MNIEVRYYSKSGNTKRIANAIAKQVGGIRCNNLLILFG
jgi:flavodoxin